MVTLDRNRRSQVWCTLVLLITFCGGMSAAFGEESVADNIAVAINHYAGLEFDAGIKVASAQLGRGDLTPADRAAVYSVLSMIHYAEGKKSHEMAFEYLDTGGGMNW